MSSIPYAYQSNVMNKPTFMPSYELLTSFFWLHKIFQSWASKIWYSLCQKERTFLSTFKLFWPLDTCSIRRIFGKSFYPSLISEYLIVSTSIWKSSNGFKVTVAAVFNNMSEITLNLPQFWLIFFSTTKIFFPTMPSNYSLISLLPE